MKRSLRQLANSPGFTLVVLLTLALCIGANSAIFSVVNAVLLRPFPFPDSERLVYVNNSYPKLDLLKAGNSIPDYLDRVAGAPSIASAGLYTWESYNLSGDARPLRVQGVRATPSLFVTLQVAPALGRAFDESHAQPGNEHVTVLSHALWQEHFGGDAAVIGTTIRLHGVPHTVLGVMPEQFQFPRPEVMLWTPYAFTPEQRSDAERGTEYSSMIVRLQAGAASEQLEQECIALVGRTRDRLPEARIWLESSGFTARVSSLLEENVGDVRTMLWLLQAGVIAALLIGCANVGNLLLTRAVARERELAIRAALGAGRWQLIRQLGLESACLFVAGGVLGLLVAMWGLSSFDALGLADLPRGETVRLDVTVFAFTLVSVGLTGLVFGVLPALHGSRANAADALRESGARVSSSVRQRRLRHGLVVAEIALAVMLLATAGLLYRSFVRVQQESPGFEATSVVTARLTLPATSYDNDAKLRAFADRLTVSLRELPGVQSVGFSNAVPFGYTSPQGTYAIAGQERPPDVPLPHGLIRSVSADYFATLRIPVLQGRAFLAGDSDDTEPVVIIDRVLANRYFADRDPIGQFLSLGVNEPQNLRRIVGVVGTVKHYGLDDETTKETVYLPYAQRPVESFTLVVRTALPASEMIPAVRRTVLRLDPEQPLFDIQTLSHRIDASLARRRTPMRLIGLFSGMALLLATLGVYGALAFSVSQRTHEFGIRAALGATAGTVLSLVLRQGLILVGIGIALGVGGYLIVSRFLRHFVFEIAPLDPVSLVAGPAVLFLVALIACLVPARRATKVDPLVALRVE